MYFIVIVLFSFLPILEHLRIFLGVILQIWLLQDSRIGKFEGLFAKDNSSFVGGRCSSQINSLNLFFNRSQGHDFFTQYRIFVRQAITHVIV